MSDPPFFAVRSKLQTAPSRAALDRLRVTTGAAYTWEPNQAKGAACYLKTNIVTSKAGLKGAVSVSAHAAFPFRVWFLDGF